MSFWEGSQSQCQHCGGMFAHRDDCKNAPPGRCPRCPDKPAHHRSPCRDAPPLPAPESAPTMLSWYHAKDGLCFTRTADGDVIVIAKDAKGDARETWSLPASMWASAVSHVSNKGESHETWLAALTFHGKS